MKSPTPHVDHGASNDDLRPTYLESRLDLNTSTSKINATAAVLDFNELIQNDSFKGFLSKSSRVIERAMFTENAVDILKDYSIEKGSTARSRSLKDILLVPRSSFESLIVKGDHFMKLNSDSHYGLVNTCSYLLFAGRPVMDIQSSPISPELLLVAYGTNHVKASIHQRTVHRLQP